MPSRSAIPAPWSTVQAAAARRDRATEGGLARIAELAGEPLESLPGGPVLERGTWPRSVNPAPPAVLVLNQRSC